jgi:hypothetical protein
MEHLRPDDLVTAVERLRRWEGSGGAWQVARRTSSGLEIVLLTCDGGEEMGQLASSDPALLAYVGDRCNSP